MGPNPVSGHVAHSRPSSLRPGSSASGVRHPDGHDFSVRRRIAAHRRLCYVRSMASKKSARPVAGNAWPVDSQGNMARRNQMLRRQDATAPAPYRGPVYGDDAAEKAVTAFANAGAGAMNWIGNQIYGASESMAATFTNPAINMIGRAFGKNPNLRQAGPMEAATNTGWALLDVATAGQSRAAKTGMEAALSAYMKPSRTSQMVTGATQALTRPGTVRPSVRAAMTDDVAHYTNRALNALTGQRVIVHSSPTSGIARLEPRFGSGALPERRVLFGWDADQMRSPAARYNLLNPNSPAAKAALPTENPINVSVNYGKVSQSTMQTSAASFADMLQDRARVAANLDNYFKPGEIKTGSMYDDFKIKHPWAFDQKGAYIGAGGLETPNIGSIYVAQTRRPGSIVGNNVVKKEVLNSPREDWPLVARIPHRSVASSGTGKILDEIPMNQYINWDRVRNAPSNQWTPETWRDHRLDVFFNEGINLPREMPGNQPTDYFRTQAMEADVARSVYRAGGTLRMPSGPSLTPQANAAAYNAGRRRLRLESSLDRLFMSPEKFNDKWFESARPVLNAQGSYGVRNEPTTYVYEYLKRGDGFNRTGQPVLPRNRPKYK